MEERKPLSTPGFHNSEVYTSSSHFLHAQNIDFYHLLITADPWTTRVWTAQFRFHTQIHTTVVHDPWLNPRIGNHWYRGPPAKLYMEFWLHSGLELLFLLGPHFFPRVSYNFQQLIYPLVKHCSIFLSVSENVKFQLAVNELYAHYLWHWVNMHTHTAYTY